LWGEVGPDKTMLMDAFFAGARIEPKRQVHFHAFMQNIHARLHRARKSRQSDDAISAVAHEVAAEARLLCLDEMHIADIADAMIIGRLFERLLDEGAVVVTTSNIHPGDLYKDGLSRDLFVPFIRLIERKLDTVKVDGLIDYRLSRVKGL